MTEQGTSRTLRLYGPGSMDHLDPCCSYYMLSGQILRLFTRQLFSYEAVDSLVDWRQISPVPDLAQRLPSRDNGDISADQLTYTIRLRDGIEWDTSPARPLTSYDVVRGFKRMCNPVLRAGAIHYFTSTIRGFQQFADAFATEVDPEHASPEQLARYQDEYQIEGITALDERTVQFHLTRPTLDFLYILATTFTSPAPREYDKYLPDSTEFRQHVRSIGPYRVSEYDHGRWLRMDPNPDWAAHTDPIRHQHLSGVEVVMEYATPDQVRERIANDEADLSWASPVTEPYDVDPKSSGNNLGFALNPYLVFNLASPNANSAMGNVLIRRAIAFAVNKAAMARIFEELAVGTVMWPAHCAIPPGNDGFEEYDAYPSPGDQGDPEAARALLEQAGYKNGLTLKMAHREVDANPEIAHSLAKDLEPIGITLDLIPLGHADYYPFLQNPRNAYAGAWDISAPAWTPDWFGSNGRAFLQPMLQTNTIAGTGNYGLYSNPEVDRTIEAALAATTRDESAALWKKVDRLVITDAAIVPILVHAPTIPHLKGRRVNNAIPMPTIDRWFDLANLWLDDSHA